MNLFKAFLVSGVFTAATASAQASINTINCVGIEMPAYHLQVVEERYLGGDIEQSKYAAWVTQSEGSDVIAETTTVQATNQSTRLAVYDSYNFKLKDGASVSLASVWYPSPSALKSTFTGTANKPGAPFVLHLTCHGPTS